MTTFGELKERNRQMGFVETFRRRINSGKAKAERRRNYRISKTYMPLEEVTQRARNMEKSGCGCYRYPARDLFNEAYVKSNPERTLALMDILEYRLCSPCGGKSKTPSNEYIMDYVEEAVEQILDKPNSPYLERAIDMQRKILNRRVDYNYSIDNLINKAIALAKANRQYEAIRLLDNIKNIGQKCNKDNEEGQKALAEAVDSLITSYGKRIISDLTRSKEKIEVKREKLALVARTTKNEKLKEKIYMTLDRLSLLYDKVTYKDPLLISNDNYHYALVNPLSETQSEKKQEKDVIVYRLNKDKDKEVANIDKRISYLENLARKVQAPELRTQMQSVVKEKEECIAKYKAQEESETAELVKSINEIEAQRARIIQEKKDLEEKIKTRTLKQAEYRELIHNIRKQYYNKAQAQGEN